MNLRFSIALLAALTATACGDVPRHEAAKPEISNLRSETSDPTDRVSPANIPTRININTASVDELQRLPHVGVSMAEKIIEHREKFGPFTRPEELILIDGISDVRFRSIRHLIRVR
ncbi:MAG: ComEA family DNA-binding protein [Pyrinomonadaceae bacterium]